MQQVQMVSGNGLGMVVANVREGTPALQTRTSELLSYELAGCGLGVSPHTPHGPHTIVSRYTPLPAQMPSPPVMLLFTLVGVPKMSPVAPTLASYE